MAEVKGGKVTKNTMAYVRCPIAGGLVWANSSKSGYRCTSCGGIHEKVSLR